MAVDYTTTGLLASIRRRAMLPSASATGTADADLLALANEELRTRLAADLVKVREEYFDHVSDTTLSGTRYRVPSRGIGQSIREAALVDSGGGLLHLARIRPEKLEAYASATSDAFGFYLEGGFLNLVPSAASSYSTLRLWILLRPAELVATNFGTITAINTSTGLVTFTATGTFAPTTSSTLDLVSAKPGFDVLAFDETPTANGSGTVTFSAVPTGLAVGDYVCTADQSPVPQVPAEFHPVLAQRVAVTVLRSLGDREAVKDAVEHLAEMEAANLVLTSPRTQGAPEKLTPRAGLLFGRRSPLRGV